MRTFAHKQAETPHSASLLPRSDAASGRIRRDHAPLENTISSHTIHRMVRTTGADARLIDYEQEAACAAENVMRMPDLHLQLARQEQAGQCNPTQTAATPIVHDAVTSPGQGLDPSARAYFEPRFGYDFSRVRVHFGPDAAQSAWSLNANAYTLGHNIVFGSGRYAPATPEGRRLIAHELMHVVQQSHAEGPYIQCQKKSVEPPSSRGDAFLTELAMWPQEAHARWKRLAEGEKLAVRMMMGERYGQDFADQFVTFTRSGARQDSQHYGPGFAEHSPEWFKQRGFRLARRDSLNDWWVHPSGFEVTADRGIPWVKSGVSPSTTRTPPIEASADNLRDMLTMSLEEIRSGTEDARNRQQELVEKKDAMDKMGVTSSEFKTAYENYVNALNEAKKTAEDMDSSIDAMEAAVKDMGGDISPLEAARGELADLRTGFDVSADMLKMQGRVPITADIK